MLEQGQILFGNIVNIALENLTNLWKYDIWYLITGLVQNLGHIPVIVFLELWAQLFKENLGIRQLAIKLKETQSQSKKIVISKVLKVQVFLKVWH